MRFFFRSNNFKILVAVTAVILAVTVTVSVISNVSSPISSFFGAVLTPVQKAFSSISNKVDDFKTSIGDNQELMDEINRLKEENAQLSNKLTGYEQALKDNEFYEQFLGIKDKNPEMLFQSATVTAKDFTDPYKSFTVNVGSLDGVSLHDPVITSLGLVGYITEIAPTYAKVTTVLSPVLKAGGNDSRTDDKGVISGRADLAVENKCHIYNLQRDCTVSVGDYIITSGGSVFPAGIIVGKVVDIKQQSKDTSLYAVIASDVDFDNLSKVMIVTYYSGQNSVLGSGE